MNDFKEQFADDIKTLIYGLRTTVAAQRMNISYPESCYRLGMLVGRFNELNETKGFRLQWMVGTSYIYVFSDAESTGWSCKYVITPVAVEDYSSEYTRTYK